MHLKIPPDPVTGSRGRWEFQIHSSPFFAFSFLHFFILPAIWPFFAIFYISSVSPFFAFINFFFRCVFSSPFTSPPDRSNHTEMLGGRAEYWTGWFFCCVCKFWGVDVRGPLCRLFRCLLCFYRKESEGIYSSNLARGTLPRGESKYATFFYPPQSIALEMKQFELQYRRTQKFINIFKQFWGSGILHEEVRLLYWIHFDPSRFFL